MPPFEGLDAMNLRRRSSLYDNIVDEVNSYGSGLKERFHISFHSNREDVVATRDIIVGKHPLYEPGTPEWDKFVLGKEEEAQEQHEEEYQELEELLHPDKTEDSAWQKEQRKRPSNGKPHGCQNPSDVLEWLEMFTTMCVAPKAPKNCSGWTTDDIVEPREEEMKAEVQRMPSAQSDDTSLPTPSMYKNRVLYPIAKYPSRLDSQRLVEQRRKFLESQINFKPLRLESRKPRKPKKY